MRNRVVALAVMVVLVAGLGFGGGWLHGSWRGHQVVRLSVDGVVLLADPPPILVDGTAYVPIRSLAGLVGWEIDWDDSARTVMVGTGQEGESTLPQQTFDTGWLLRSNGATGSLALPAGRIVSAKITFKGKSVTVAGGYETATNTASGSGVWNAFVGKYTAAPDRALPAVPSGYSFYRHEAAMRLSAESSGFWDLSVKLPDRSPQISSGTGTSGSVADSQTIDRVGQLALGTAGHANAFTYVLAARTIGYRAPSTTHTIDPSVTIGGVATGHVGTLADGEESIQYDLSGLAVETTNAITYAVSGSGVAYYRIVVVMEVGQAVSYVEPDAFEVVMRAELVIELTVTGDVSPATAWFPRVKADRNSDFADPEYDWNSVTSQVDWEYWFDAAWAAMPGTGAPIGAPVRFTPPADEMGLYLWHLQARSWDATTNAWGAATARTFRLVQTVSDIYALDIEGVDYTETIDWMVIEHATTGEPGGIILGLLLIKGEAVPEDADAINASIKDIRGNVLSFLGKVRGDPARTGDGLWQVYCKLPDAQLSEQRILRTTDYPNQDIGVTFKAIIDTYYSGFNSLGIDVATGFERPVGAWGRTAADVAAEFRRQYPVLIYVDTTALPAKVVLIKTADLDSSVVVCARGQAVT